MKEEVLKEAMARIDALAAKMGIAAEQLWGILVRQQYIEALETILFCIFFIGGGGYAIKVIAKKKWFNIDHMEERDLEGLCIGSYVGAALWGIGVLIGLICLFGEVPSQLLNPEYGAYRALIGAV